MGTRVEFEERYRDTATGYEGVATARTEYLGGAVKVLLERVKRDGSVEETWWPEPRLEPATPDGGRPGFGPRT